MAQQELPHKIVLQEGKVLTVTGVSEVLGFEESQALLQTGLGLLTVYGSDLQLKTLTPEGGQVLITGTVNALAYEQPRKTGGFFGRLFK